MKFLFITIVCVLLNGMSFRLFREKTTSEQIISFFLNLQTVQQEKLYLHLDKPYYAAGEQIWFKGYLVNSSTHAPDMPDNFIYVELVNQNNKIVCRQKVKKNEGGFWGNLLLPTDMIVGEYTLRGYTNWMRNANVNFFFQKNIPIANTLDRPDTLELKKKDISKNDFSVSFFPEGGHLLTGYRQQMAFKCQRSNGYSGMLEGYIVNQSGDTLTQVKSEHDGMGAFSFLPAKDNSYYALVRSPGCEEKKIQLPKAEDSGITLSLNQSAGKIRYQIFSSLPDSQQSDSVDSLSSNIYSDLLLVSDLKGFVENPGWYFKEKSRTTIRGLDLLMLTHGWSRFDITPFAEQSLMPDYFVEKGQYISGRILNFFGKEAKDAAIVAVDPANNLVRTLESDEKGCFLLDGIDYCDSTTFVVIKMDEETVPVVEDKNLFPDSLFVFNPHYLSSAMDAGGMRVINLEDVVIEGKRTQTAKEKAERVWADYSMTEDMLGKSVSRTAKDLFRQAMGGADVSDPLVVIDGMCCWDDNYILETIYPDDMRSFDVFRDQKRCKYGSISKSTPAVVITLKPEAMNRKRKGVALFHSQGYVKPDQFYHPVYETPDEKKSEKMDIRSTLYWNPTLEIDSQGEGSVEFYASDLPASYHVVIEGVDESGQLYRYSGNLLKNAE